MWTFLALLAPFYVGGVCVLIIGERRSPVSTLAWLLALVFLPGFGVGLYFAIGPRRFERKRNRHVRARLKVRTQHPKDKELSSALHAAMEALTPRWRQLAHLGMEVADAPPSLASDAEIYTSGRSCFEDMERDIRAATHHIHVFYYIFAPDGVGTKFRDLLIERAKAGVHVRVLVDAVGSSSLTKRFLAPMREAGIDVARFNPPKLLRVFVNRGRFNFRNHRKILICDGRVAFTGGLNVGDEYVVGLGDRPPWRDTHVRIEGGPVRWLQLAFLEDWHFTVGTSPFGSSYFPASAGPGRHLVQVVATGPDLETPALECTILTAINGARRRLYVTTPYFVPDEALYLALATARLRGVDVRLLVPRTNDSSFVAAAARSYYDQLLRVGVRIFEYLPTMLHAKSIVVDEDLAVVGSANIDNRSMRLNFEVMLFVYSTSFTKELGEIFIEDLHQSEEVTLDARRGRSRMMSVYEDGARLFSPLL